MRPIAHEQQCVVSGFGALQTLAKAKLLQRSLLHSRKGCLTPCKRSCFLCGNWFLLGLVSACFWLPFPLHGHQELYSCIGEGTETSIMEL